MNEIKLTGKSIDILNENIETLKQLFPEIITEEKIDFDKFKTLFGEEIDDSSERYSFTWPGKINAMKESQKQSTGTLRPCKEESKNWETTKNLYIEGDNLEVLKLLQKGYYGKIKAIYIDPPYNTGKDFIYPDDYKNNLENYLEITGQTGDGQKLTTNTESDGRFHSNWLNMMYPRLKLARNLLRDDGVIFISIDDNELENLKKICNEIFGEENCLDRGVLTWINKGSTKGFNKVVKNHEYILAYGKNSANVKSSYGKNFPNDMEKLEHYCFNKPSPKNPYCEIKFLAGCPIEGISDVTFEKEVGDTVKLEIIGDEPMIFKNGVLQNDVILRGTFPYRYQIEEFFKNQKLNLPTYDRKGQLWKEIFFNKNGMPRYRKIRNTKIISSVIDDENIPNYGSNDISELFGKKEIFSFPKPKELIYHLLSYFVEENDIVLDFFAGSSTTAHALFNLNIASEGKRSFIIVQIPELLNKDSEAYKDGFKNICDIGKERIRRAGDKIVNESGNPNLDIGFKVFKLDSSNLNKWDPDYEDLEQTLLVAKDNIKLDRTQEDLIYEIMLKYGIDLTLPIQTYDVSGNKIYSIGFGALLICLDDEITKEIAYPIIELSKDSEITRVVFKDNGFASDADKTNIKETLRTHHIDEFITI